MKSTQARDPQTVRSDLIDIAVNVLKRKMVRYSRKSYLQSVKHSIVDYILMDESEKKRLSITKTPEFYQPIVVRSPVPWSVSFGQAKEGFQFYEEQNER